MIKGKLVKKWKLLTEQRMTFMYRSGYLQSGSYLGINNCLQSTNFKKLPIFEVKSHGNSSVKSSSIPLRKYIFQKVIKTA
jgi:hypothetical protein